MAINIDFDISALCFCMAMLFAYYRKKCIPSLQNKIFSMFIWVCLIAAATDIIDVVMNLYPYRCPAPLHALVLYIYFIAIDMLPMLYAFYIVSLTGTLDRLFHRKQGLLFYIPGALTLFIIFSNLFIGQLFSMDETGRFIRGDAVSVLNMLAIYFMLLGICYAYTYRQIIPASKRLALYSFALFATFPVIVQIYFPHLYIITFGVAICIFLIFMTIQNPEEVVSDVGLLNKTALHSTASIYFRRGEHFVILAIKINEFGYLQRVFGTHTTQPFLIDTAGRLDRFMPGKTCAYHLADGCFALLIPEQYMNDTLPERILKLFDSAVKTPQIDICFSVSACVLHCPQDASDADLILEYIKYFHTYENSKNHLYCASDLHILDTARRQEIEHAIDYALEHDGLTVYYQPIFSTKENRITSAEALVRLYDEKLGYICPEEFIPISERKGSIPQIGMFVFRSVCEYYHKHKLNEQGIHCIHVNLSVAQCMQKNLTAQLISTLKEFDLPIGCINLEITETVAAESPEILLNIMDTLSNVGIQFSLDDYGTGYSNMVSLIDMPFSLVKLDKQLIKNITGERTQIAIGHTISMFKELHLGIVAEGVETSKQVEMLTKMRCDYLQGFYFSKPLSGLGFLQYLQDSQKK